MLSSLKHALAALRNGKPVVLYDGDEREGEADLVYHAHSITPEKIHRLRRDAGGLICVALGEGIAGKIGIPFISDIIASSGRLHKMVVKKTAYGDKPAFSIAVNHKDVYTGIPDNDRALTIKRLAGIIRRNNGLQKDFIKNFYTPGHVFLLIGRGIRNRRGHTELSLALAERARLPGIMVLCEMLGKGKALNKAQARAYAEKNKLVFIEGSDI